MTVCMTVLTGSAGGPSRAQVLSSPAKSANTLSPHTNAALPKHTSNDHQSPHLRPGEAPAPPPRPSISASSFRSFIATIPFLSLTASLICPCVYYGNPLHGSTETESSEWERESSGGRVEVAQVYGRSRWSPPNFTLIKQTEMCFDRPEVM